MSETQFEGDIFECVASVQQMNEIPEDNPVSGIPYYRKDTLEINTRSPQLLEELWLAVQEDTVDLVVNYRAAQNLVATETVTIT